MRKSKKSQKPEPRVLFQVRIKREMIERLKHTVDKHGYRVCNVVEAGLELILGEIKKKAG